MSFGGTTLSPKPIGDQSNKLSETMKRRRLAQSPANLTPSLPLVTTTSCYKLLVIWGSLWTLVLLTPGTCRRGLWAQHLLTPLPGVPGDPRASSGRLHFVCTRGTRTAFARSMESKAKMNTQGVPGMSKGYPDENQMKATCSQGTQQGPKWWPRVGPNHPEGSKGAQWHPKGVTAAQINWF